MASSIPKQRMSLKWLQCMHLFTASKAHKFAKIAMAGSAHLQLLRTYLWIHRHYVHVLSVYGFTKQMCLISTYLHVCSCDFMPLDQKCVLNSETQYFYFFGFVPMLTGCGIFILSISCATEAWCFIAEPFLQC